MSTTEETRAVVQGVYDAVNDGDHERYLSYLHPDIRVSCPPYFEHGGPDSPFDKWQSMLAGLRPALDIAGLTLQLLIAEGDTACATAHVPLVSGTGGVIFCETWTVHEGKAVRMRVFCYDPEALLAALRVGG
jgi:ketosteroid isomerase-like protein